MSLKSAARRSSPTKRSDNHQRRQPIKRQALMGGSAPAPAEMQQRLGNRGTQAWLAEQKKAQPLQAKLTTGKSDEIHEQADDRIAETHMPEPVTSSDEEPSFQNQPLSSRITPVVSTTPKKMAQAVQPLVQVMPDVGAEYDKEAVVAQKPLIQIPAEAQAAMPGAALILGVSDQVEITADEPEMSMAPAPAPDMEAPAGEGSKTSEGDIAPEEAPSELSPEQAVGPAVAAVARRASSAASHQPPEAASGNAIAASNRPAVTQRRNAEGAGIAAAEGTETGAVDEKSFEEALREAIERAMPDVSSEDDAREVMRDGGNTAAAEVQQTLGQQQTQAVGNLPATVADENLRDPSGQPGGEEVALAPEAVGDAPAGVSAAPVVPPSSTESAIDTSANRESVNVLSAENNITKDQLSKGNDPQFQAALGTREEAETHDREAPTKLRKAESADRQGIQAEATNVIAGGLAGFQAERVTRLSNVANQQTSTQGLTETRKQQITTDIEDIGLSVREDVTRILKEMDEGATGKFQTAINEALEDYDDAFAEEKGGFFSSVGDLLTGDWGDERFNRALALGRRAFEARIERAITDIATFVELKLTEARKRITDGKTEIDRYMTENISEAEQEFATEATSAITADFDALEGEISDRKNALVDSMVDIYREGVERRNAREEQLREENKSLWQRVYDATVGVVLQIVAFKDMLLGILARAAAVVESIIQDPIGFLGNLISGIKSGLDLFFGNIVAHLKRGLLGWLFGALEGAGIQLPDSFDFKGILSLIMQVLGLTYANIRKRAVTLLGEDMVSRLEEVAEIFMILFTEGPAGLWRMLMEQLSGIKDMLLEEIQGFVISEIIEAGVKWLIGLLNPAAAFIKACMMIYDIIIFFIERGSQIVELVNAIINSLGAIVSGKVQAMALAVEGALGRILPVAISFFAALVGLGGISGKIREIIEKIQEPINTAIDWVIGKAVQLARAAGNLFKGDGKKDKEEIPETDDPEHDAKLTAGLSAIDTAEQAHLENGEITRENAEEVARYVKQQHPIFKSLQVVDGGKTWDYNYTASPNATVTGETKSGDEPINDYIDKTLFQDGNKEFTSEGSSLQGKIERLGYEFRKQNDKYHIRRRDSSNTIEVHINEGGQLKLGAKSGSSQPEHDNYIPTEKIIEETANGYLVKYKTKTDQGESGPEFKIDINYDKALTSNEDVTETRTVSGSNLKLKASGGARGRTNSAQQGFHNAHLIADRFGGSGRNSDKNIYPSSPTYNTITMKSKEDAIASNLIQNKSGNQNNFKLDVTAQIKGEKANSSSLKTAINEEAKKDNTLQVQQINDEMSQDLVALVRKDIKGIPGKFISVSYKLNDKTEGNIGEDSDYQKLINELLKNK